MNSVLAIECLDDLDRDSIHLRGGSKSEKNASGSCWYPQNCVDLYSESSASQQGSSFEEWCAVIGHQEKGWF